MRFKKILATLALVLLMFTSVACGKLTGEKTDITPQLAKSYTVSADILYNNTETTALLTRVDDGVWEAEFTAPNTLAGITLLFNGDDVTANYKGLSFSVPKNASPYKNILTYFISAADELAKSSTAEVTKTDNNFVLEGTNDTGEFVMKLDANNGEISEFSMPGIELEMKFKDYSADVANNEDGDQQNIVTEDVNGEVTGIPKESGAENVQLTEVNAEVTGIPKESGDETTETTLVNPEK